MHAQVGRLRMWAGRGPGWVTWAVCVGLYFLSAASHAAGSPADCPQEVRVGFLETSTPPFLTLPKHEEAVPGGLFADWVLAGVSQTRCKPTVKLLSLPRKRAYWKLAHDELDFFLPAVPTVADLSQFAYPMKAGRPNGAWSFETTSASLWVRKDEVDIRWDGQVLSGPSGFEVGVAVGSPSEMIAKRKGWRMALSKTSANCVDRLVHGRIHVILAADMVVSAFPPEVLGSLRRLGPPLARFDYHAIGSKTFVSRYPDLANEFWQGLCQAGRAYASKHEGAAPGSAAVCR